MPLTKAQQRAGAYAMQAKHGSDCGGKASANARWQKLLTEVDPNNKLGDAERAKRASALQKSRMIILAQKSAESRAQKKQEKLNTLQIQAQKEKCLALI